MNCPQTLKYSKTHEWVLAEEGIATIGLSDFAQDELGDIVYVEMPEVDDTFEAGDTLGEVESVKAVSEVNCPLSGTIVEINEELLDSPEAINSDPYGAWICKVSYEELPEDLMDADAYAAYCEAEKNA